MTNAKQLKRALLSSVLALVLCFSMLLGTTFAWFTDSVTSADNKIVAGKLDIQLFMWTDETTAVEITNESAPLFGKDALTNQVAQNNAADTLWEPGKTQVVYLSLKNNGTLDLKYMVSLDVRNGDDATPDVKLSDVMQYNIAPDAEYGDVSSWDGAGIDVVPGTNATTANNVKLAKGEQHFFALSVHMDENAGDEYQGEELSFDIKVVAGQITSESDSFGDDYDALAPYGEGGFLVASSEVQSTADGEGNFTTTNADNTFKTAGTAAAGDTITSKITPANSTTAAFDFAGTNGRSIVSYDISVSGQADGSEVTVDVFVGKNLVGVVVYHNGVEMPTGDYSYNPTTGYVTFTTTDFSPFDIVYKEATNVPVAKVTKLDNYPKDVLDVAYLFSTTEVLDQNGDGEENEADLDYFIANNPYAYWHADFVVTFDKDVAKESITLGGQYDAWSENWVYFGVPMDVAANEPVRLLASVKELYPSIDEITINYTELCAYVRNFACGVGDVDGANAGTTVTVELRIYETVPKAESVSNSVNEETGNYLTICTYRYVL